MNKWINVLAIAAVFAGYLLWYWQKPTTNWWEAPIATKPRQQLESALIAKWKSPFNKQNWDVWGTPFV